MLTVLVTHRKKGSSDAHIRMDGTPGSPTVVMYGNDDSCRYFRLVDKSEDPGSNGTRAVQYDAAGEDHDGPIYLYANTPGVCES